MLPNLIVHTHVNEIMSGAISNVTLNVEQGGNIVLSATVAIGETTVGTLQTAKVNTDSEELIKEAFSMLATELHTHGIETKKVDTINCDLPAELNCSVITIA